MQDGTRATMRRVFDKLPQEKLDDVESQFENTEVIFQQTLERIRAMHEHYPPLELHAGELAQTLYSVVVGLMEHPMSPDQFLAYLHTALFDYVRGSILFGYQIGKMGWPIMQVPCEEAHNRD